ncbi:MAG TPA: MFS transporter [Thermomicrobiales bacterium]|nr:MFS transporter [Thermomicrobiales bacterium]
MSDLPNSNSPPQSSNDHVRRRHKRSYFALISSSFVSNTGNAFSNLAIPLFVLATTGSATRTGIVAFVNYTPPVIAAIFGGALVDRIGRRRTLMTADALSGIATALIPLLYMADLLSFPLLLAIVAFGAFLDSPGRAARSSMIPGLADRAGYSPERAQSLSMSGFFLSQVIGPAVAGLVVAASGPTTAIWVNAVTFVLSLAIVGNIVHEPEIATPVKKSTYLEDLREGFHFVWHDGFMRAMIILASAFSMVFIPLYTVLYPVYFTRLIGSTRALGFFLGAEAAGNLIGAIAYGYIGERFSRFNAFVFSLAAWVPFFAVMLFTPPVWLLLVAGFLSSLASGAINPIFQVAFQVRTPESMRPRVYSMVTAGNLMAVPVGALLIGPLIELIGVIPTLGIVVALGAAAPVVCFLVPVFREIDTPIELTEPMFEERALEPVT